MRKHKILGQNFLIDEAVAQRIVESANIVPKDVVLEIGPGHGILTRNFLETGARVLALEIDPSLCPELEKRFGNFPNFQLVRGDALKFDYSSVGPRFKVISNLPYYAATHILKRLIIYRNRIVEMVVMLQKEVVDRLAAQPGKKDYSSLTVFVQYHCDVERILQVSKSSFSPAPKINSTVVRIIPLDEPRVHVANEKELFKVVHAAFLHKRKMLKNNLSEWGRWFQKEGDILTLAGVDLNRRGETLSIEEFASLANISTSDDSHVLK